MHYFLRNYRMNAKIYHFSVRLHVLGYTTQSQLPSFTFMALYSGRLWFSTFFFFFTTFFCIVFNRQSEKSQFWGYSFIPPLSLGLLVVCSLYCLSGCLNSLSNICRLPLQMSRVPIIEMWYKNAKLDVSANETLMLS